MLIGGATYFDGLTEQIVAVNSSPDDEGKPHPFTALRDEVYGGDHSPATPGYIHLKDAHFIIPGAPAVPANRGVYWRGKLEAVDGFTFGLLTAG